MFSELLSVSRWMWTDKVTSPGDCHCACKAGGLQSGQMTCSILNSARSRPGPGPRKLRVTPRSASTPQTRFWAWKHFEGQPVRAALAAVAVPATSPTYILLYMIPLASDVNHRGSQNQSSPHVKHRRLHLQPRLFGLWKAQSKWIPHSICNTRQSQAKGGRGRFFVVMHAFFFSHVPKYDFRV